MAASTLAPECEIKLLKGGYTVQPVPAPLSIKQDKSNNVKDGGNNQKLILFNRGKAMSGAPNIIGTNQLLKAPISKGMVIKKIIINACPVTKTLYTWKLPFNIWLPG